jgi:hypothetical protein
MAVNASLMRGDRHVSQMSSPRPIPLGQLGAASTIAGGASGASANAPLVGSSLPPLPDIPALPDVPDIAPPRAWAMGITNAGLNAS